MSCDHHQTVAPRLFVVSLPNKLRQSFQDDVDICLRTTQRQYVQYTDVMRSSLSLEDALSIAPVRLSVCLSVPCLRFTQNQKAVENFAET